MRTTLFPTLLAFSGLLLALPDDCDECVVAAHRTTLCKPHSAEQRRVLKESKKGRKADEPLARGRAYRLAAELTEDHRNAPAPQVAEFVGEGLLDPSLVVRIEARALLLDGQHPEEMMKAFLQAMRESQSEWKSVESDLARRYKDLGKYDPENNVSKEELAWITGYPAWFESLAGTLGRLPDPRSLKALESLLDRRVTTAPGFQFVAACKALITLGNAEGIERVLDFLERAEGPLRKGKVPHRIGTRARGTLLGLWVAMYDNFDEDRFVSILTALREDASLRDLPRPPEAELGTAKAWKAWFEENAASYDTQLTRIVEPVRLRDD